MITARYVHTNLIARDWRSLAAFYKNVFGCTPAGPERDLSGPVMEAGTALKGAHLRGAHLCLPGHGDNGPTLEIFQYEPTEPGLPPQINRPGFGHIAFLVDDVAAARAAAGGRMLDSGLDSLGFGFWVLIPGSESVCRDWTVTAGRGFLSRHSPAPAGRRRNPRQGDVDAHWRRA